jgi:hypothetical protein
MNSRSSQCAGRLVLDGKGLGRVPQDSATESRFREKAVQPKNDVRMIPGGMIPGVVIVQPDYRNSRTIGRSRGLKNEYVVDTVTTFIPPANAANSLAR